MWAKLLIGLRKAEPAPPDSMGRIVERMLRDLDRADPLGKAAQLERLVRLQAALIVDLRNRVAALEKRG